MNRGLSVVDTLKILKDDQLTTEELFKSRVLGWCVEWVRIKIGIMKNYIMNHGPTMYVIFSFKHSSSLLMISWMHRSLVVEIHVGTKW